MRRNRLFPAGLLGLLLVAGLSRGDAPKPPSPLRLIPAEADFLIQVHNPRLPPRANPRSSTSSRSSSSSPSSRSSSTPPRRADSGRCSAFFEKQLGAAYPELLDAVAGGGIALAGKFAPNNPPALLVIQGTDEKRVEQFLASAMAVLEGELKRQESKDRIEKGVYEGVAGFRLGGLCVVARVGAAIVASNNKDAMGKCLLLHSGKEKKSLASHPGVIEAAKLLPASRLAIVWISMKTIHASPAGKALYASPRDNFLLTLLFGGILDFLGRTPFVCAGLTLDSRTNSRSPSAPRAAATAAGPTTYCTSTPRTSPGHARC